MTRGTGDGASRGGPTPEWLAGDPERAEARLDAWAQGVHRRLDDVQRLSAEAAALRVSVSGARNAVTVELDGSGCLTGVRFTAEIQRYTPVQLAGEVMAVHRRAQALLVQRMQELVAASVGADSATGQALAAGLRRRFGMEPDGGGAGDGTGDGPR